MTDSLFIRHLPDWSYAGKPVEGTLAHHNSTDGPFEIYHMSSSKPATDDDLGLKPYKVVNGYLIPHYESKESSRNRRNQELLRDRVQRFFYSVEPNIEARRTAAEIQSEIALFDHKLTAINGARAANGLNDFSLSTPYRDYTRNERELVSQGANFVGHAVNRLGRLGRIILQGNATGITFEHDDAWVTENLDTIKAEFKDLYARLTDNTHQSLVRCVLTRDGRVDHDGVFHHLIREIAKPVMESMRDGVTEEQGKNIELMARNNLVIEIGNCLESIDDTYRITQVMTEHKVFREFIRQADKARFNETKPLVLSTGDMDLSGYSSLLSEYREICRARACIRNDDADNYNRVADRLRFLQSEIGLYHEALFQASAELYKHSPQMREMATQTVSLLKRGVSIMGEQAELRLPRNAKANGIYDEGQKHMLPDDPDLSDEKRLNVPEKERFSKAQRQDMSTVGRYRAKVWLLQHNLLRGQSAEI